MEDNKFLGVSRKYNKNLFGLPGGKVEDNQSFEQTAIKELFEETGLVAEKVIPIFALLRDDSYFTIVFATKVDGKISTSESGVVRPVSKEELCSGPFGSYNLKLFNSIDLEAIIDMVGYSKIE